MTHDPIDYTALANEAMHLIVCKILKEVQKNGMPDHHHFTISFNTRHPKVKLSKDLSQTYPKEMTIVLQYQFQNLAVYQKGFFVTLKTQELNEKMYIPFAAITSFSDPVGQFSLQFQQPEPESENVRSLTQKQYAADTKAAAQAEDPNSNVVSFEKFKRKHTTHKVSRNWL